VLSFHDAEPLPADARCRAGDEFTVADLFDHLRYENACLRFRCATLRGRSLNTEVTVRPDGAVAVAVRDRKQAPLRWLGLLGGRGRGAAE
jgi:hypothetical protein